MKMKLYKLSQNVNNDYDTYDSVIVSAVNEDDAKTIHPSEYVTHYRNGDWYGTHTGGDERGKEYKFGYYEWADISQIKVEYLGETELKRGVILASFNAG